MNKLKVSAVRFFGVGLKSLMRVYPLAPKLTALLVIIALISPLLNYVVARLSAAITNNIQLIVRDGQGDSIKQLLVAYGTILASASILGIFEGSIRHTWIAKLGFAREDLVMKKRYSLDIGRIKSPIFETLVRRIAESPYGWNTAREVAQSQLSSFETIIGVVTSAVIVASFSKMLAGLLLLFILPDFMLDLYIGKQIWKLIGGRAERSKMRDEARSCFQGVVGLIETKLFKSAPFLTKLITQFYDSYLSEIHKIERKKAGFGFVSRSLSIGGLVYCMYVICEAAMRKEILLGTMGLLFYGLNSMRSNCTSLLRQLSNQQEQARYIEQIDEFFALEPLLEEPENPVSLRLHEPPTIVFEGVYFKYEGQEKYALRDLNLTIRSGDKIGIFGENGSGKSTLVALLSRVYHPTEGRILINGIDLKNIDPADWRDSLSVLMQRHATYDLSVREAIGIADIAKTPTDQELQEATSYANADEVIAKLEKGFDTQLGQRFGGIDLSGGQEKRLAIARRMFRGRHFIVFDEPEKELDSESRTKFFSQLRELPVSVTAVYISHNIATLRLAQRILVFSEGCLVEEGSHDDLLRRQDSLYATAYGKEVEALLQQVQNLRILSSGAAA